MSVACRKLGIGLFKAKIVAAEICKRGSLPLPNTRKQMWEVISVFCGLEGLLHRHQPGRTAPASRQTRKMDVNADAFLLSYQWRALRMQAIVRDGRRCACCRRTPEQHGLSINVDHIKPRRTHPELALVLDNLQVLCEECNHGKGNWNDTNWREDNAYAENKPMWAIEPKRPQ